MPQAEASLAGYSAVLSLALGGSSAIDMHVRHMVRFTTAPLLLHISQGAELPHETQPLVASGRVHLNPRRMRVAPGSPGVLSAHLANFELCEEAHMPCALAPMTTSLVFLSSNTVLLRPGLEAWVAQHSVAFCIGNRCTDIDAPERQSAKAKAATSTQVGLERWRELIRPLSWNGNHGSSSTRRDARLRNDSSVTAKPFVSHFVHLLRERRTGSDVWQSTPINCVTTPLPHL